MSPSRGLSPSLSNGCYYNNLRTGTGSVVSNNNGNGFVATVNNGKDNGAIGAVCNKLELNI
jgi:hypothetical protein